MTRNELWRYKQRLYDLGFVEDDAYAWRCKFCRQPMEHVACDCELCHGACEWCASKKESQDA